MQASARACTEMWGTQGLRKGTQPVFLAAFRLLLRPYDRSARIGEAQADSVSRLAPWGLIWRGLSRSQKHAVLCSDLPLHIAFATISGHISDTLPAPPSGLGGASLLITEARLAP